MSSSKPPRLPMELALAYLLPLPAQAGGLIWAAIFSSISWALATLDEMPLIVANADGQVEHTTQAVLLFVASLMLGMLPAVFRMSIASEEWERQPKAPPLGFRERLQEEKLFLVKAVPSFGTLLPFTLIGIAVGVAINSWIIGPTWRHLQSPSVAWMTIQFLALFVLLARGIGFARFANKRRQPVYLAAEEVDLTDLTPQYRAARCAVRSGVTWLAGACFSSLFFLAGKEENWITPVVLTVVSVIAALSLLPPVLRTKIRIQQAKAAEMERLRSRLSELKPGAELAPDPDAPAAKASPSANRPGELADLLSYLHYLESLPELPFNKDRMGMLSLYFAVPLGSWVWITVVQKLLSLTLT
jgi:hypothetical protein